MVTLKNSVRKLCETCDRKIPIVFVFNEERDVCASQIVS